MYLKQLLKQTFQHLSDLHKYLLILFIVSMMIGCSNNKSEDFVKLGAPLEEMLSQITLETEIKDGVPLQFEVDSTLSGDVEYSTESDESDMIMTYSVFKQHAVEGNKYIFLVASYSWGGSGTFHYLIAIDKTTLKSVSDVFLGDRVKTVMVSLTAPDTDTVSITYMDRSSSTAMTEPHDIKIEKHFKIDEMVLQEVFSK